MDPEKGTPNCGNPPTSNRALNSGGAVLRAVDGPKFQAYPALLRGNLLFILFEGHGLVCGECVGCASHRWFSLGFVGRSEGEVSP